MRSPVTFYAGCIGHFQVGRFSFLQMERGLGPLPTVEIQRLKVIRVVQGLWRPSHLEVNKRVSEAGNMQI